MDSRNAKLSRIEKGTKFVLSNHFDVAARGRKHDDHFADGESQGRRVKPFERTTATLDYGGF